MSESTDANALPAELEDRIYAIHFDGDPSARDAALAALCASHPEHEDALQQRAEALTRSDALFGRVRAELDEAGDAERIGPFVVQKVLGQGGFGTVYLAEQTEPVRRQVALKVLQRGRVDTRSLRRFDDERQVLAQLQHACIARVYDAGKTDNGLPYFAMEYVQGEPVTTWCDRARLGIPERLRLFLRICAAIHYAHQRGVVHRDIKPSNLLVHEEDGNPLPKVIDFGIAQLLRPNDAMDPQRAPEGGEGGQAGTPGYMSPEQAAGEPSDTRADVYALGVLLCELLTGQLPMDRERLRTSGFAALAQRMREEPVRRPSVILQAATTTNPSTAQRRDTSVPALLRTLRGDLDWVALKALAHDPDDRYASVAALADDIERFLRQEPVLARTPSAAYIASKFIARHRVGVAVVVAAAVALVVGIVGLAWALDTVEDLRQRAVHEGVEAGRQRDLATASAYAASMAAAQVAMTSGDVSTAFNYLAATAPTDRGWEWRHLAAQSDHALRAIPLDNEILDIAWIDDEHLLGFQHEGEIGIWSATTGERERTLVDWNGTFRAFALDPATHRVFIANRASLGVWDYRDGHHLRRLLEIPEDVVDLAISENGERLAIADRAGHITLINTTGDPAPRRLPHQPESTAALAFLGNDGLFAAMISGPIRQLDLANGEPVAIFTGHTDAADDLLVDREQGRLFSASVDTTVGVWDLATARMQVALPGEMRMRRLALSHDASVLYACGGWSDNRVPAWETSTFTALGRYHGHHRGITGLAVDPSGQRVATSGRDLTLRVWPARPPAPFVRLDAGRDARDLAVDATGQRFASASMDGRVTVWNANTLVPDLALETEESWAGCAIGPGRVYAAGKEIVAFAVDGGDRVAIGETRGHYVERLLVDPDARWLIGGHEQKVLVWTLPELTLRHVLDIPIGAARFAFDERDDTFVLGCRDATVRWLDPKRGIVTRQQRLDTEDQHVGGIVSRDDQIVAALPGHGLVQLDRTGKLNPIAAIASGVAIAPDGSRMATSGADHKVRLWDPATMRQLLVLGDLVYGVSDVHFVAGGRRLVASSHRWDAPTYIYVWDAPPDADLPR